MPRKYVRRKEHGDAPPVLEMKIVLKPSRAYEVRHFSMLKLRELEEYHSRVQLPRKWRLSKDEKTLWLF